MATTTEPGHPTSSFGTPIESVKGFCFIPARNAGIFSWCAQILIFVLGSALAAATFLHTGGYAIIMGLSTNSIANLSQIVDPSTTLPLHPIALGNETTTASPTLPEADLKLRFPEEDLASDIIEQQKRQANDADVSEEVRTWESETPQNNTENDTVIFHGPFEQIQDIYVKITSSVGFYVLPITRCLNLVYVGFSILWLFSIAGLLLSLKLEISDLVFINFLFLLITVIGLLVQAIGILITLFRLETYRWSLILIISGFGGGFLMCFVIGIFALNLLIVWQKYISYMNNHENTCVCFSRISDIVKRKTRNGGNRRENGSGPADYSIPQATAHSHLPYIDEPPVEHFNSF